MKIRFGLLLLLPILLASCSTAKRLDSDFRKADSGREDFRGVVVYDTSTGKELINYNGNKFFIPASTVKLFTFYTAYMTLPDSVPALEYMQKGDSLIIRGTASPLAFEDPEGEGFRFLRESGSRIFLTDETIDDEVYGPGWSWDDYSYGYMPERNLFPVYGNCVRLKRDSRGLIIVPEFFAAYVSDRQNPQDQENKEELAGAGDMRRLPGENRFNARSIQRGQEVKIPFKTSNQLIADLLSEAIGRKVTLVPELKEQSFNTLRFRPYDSLYTRMLVDSDNFIAEQLLLQVGRATDSVYRVQKGIEHALSTYLRDIPQKPRWVDGSGLSRYNLFTPESQVYLLKKMLEEIPEEKLFGFFPAGGVTGTLKDHYHGPEGNPYVFAKSGTLSNNYCLSGFLRARSGRLLIFSFMDNHHRGSSSDRKKEIQAFLERLREAY